MEKDHLNGDELVFDDSEDLTDGKLCLEYGSFFDVTCVAQVDNIGLTKKVSVLQEENESLRLVRVKQGEKVVLLRLKSRFKMKRAVYVLVKMKETILLLLLKLMFRI